MTQPLNFFAHPAMLLTGGGFTLGETYPLDDVAGSTAAWSLRKVRVAYAGNCIKVRRGSDNATQDIGFNDYLLDFDALMSFIMNGDAYIDTWYDQSGNGRDMVQAATPLQPQLITGGMYRTTIANYPQIDFSGTRWLGTDTATDPQSTIITSTAGTIFALWQADTAIATGGGNTVWCNRGGWNAATIKTIAGTPNILAYGYDGTLDTVTTGSKATGTPYITAWQHDSGTLYSYIDSSTAAGSVAHGNETDLSAQMCIGRDSQSPISSSLFDGPIAEVLCWNTVLSGANMTTIGGDIASSYGLTWS